ncbi:unnamed protein product [Miscanthus lutarioriparius]|uniref:G domain-containing protein n=1 Tax=Miscanthus lutarioriparius TaxID=422564 RepID=A0A811R9Y7_9POAL|nr:unnamed protein product [Miscanthus lutarioriparius]
MAGGEEKAKSEGLGGAPMGATATERGEALPFASSMPLDISDVDAEEKAKSERLGGAPMGATATERGEALPFARSMPLDVSDVDAVLQRAAGANQLAVVASVSSDNTHLLIDPPDATGEDDDERRRLRTELEALLATIPIVPRPCRLPCDSQITGEELDAYDRLEQDYHLVFTPYEKNIDIWRQLWRVLKCSDLLVMVVDARDPLFYRCPDLEAYAKEIDEHKRTMLLVNKADLLPLNIRKRWADYFKAHDILYVFWSAKAATATLEGKKLSGYSEEESASLDLDTKIYGRDELLMKLQAEAESIVAQRRTSTSVDDQEASSSDSVSSVAKHVVVGFVGYPNVGKSSTINGWGEEDWMTKYREAIQVVADRVPRDIIEQIYKITLPKPYEPQSRPPTAAELLWAYCASRGLVSQAGLLDESKAAQQILKDYIDGKIPHYELPPGVTDSEADWEQISCSLTTSANEMGTHQHKFSLPRLTRRQNLPTPSWKNIDTCFDTWKQLWKVLKSCDFLLLVADARDPLLSHCPDLEEIDEHKRTMLLVNKADLLPLNIRKRWADYFKAHDILYVFWSAKAATATLEGKKLSGYSEEESASLDLDTKIYGRDELLMKLQAEAESIVAQRRTSTAVDDPKASSSDSVSSVAKRVVVGFVGYPSVGKSSTINALVGDEKATGVSHTPGKIKLVLYDCPGHFLPTFSVSSYGLLLEEGISFEQLAIHKLHLAVNALLAGVEASRGKVNDGLGGMTRRLKVLAEDIRVWLQSTCEVKVLIELYLKAGKGIARLIIPWYDGILPPKTRGITGCFDVIKRRSYFSRECAPTDVNLGTFSSAEKKLHKTLRESRRQGILKFVRMVNPSFKGKENIVSDEVDPKCMCCFENAGFYFNTCCNLIMCKLCAAKRCLFCKQPHMPGENLLFPVIVRRPVLPPNPLQVCGFCPIALYMSI